MAGYAGFEALPPSRGTNYKSVQVAQAAPSDAGQPRQREHHWSETLSYELTIARRDIELLQRLEQERERFSRLEQDLAAARRDTETKNAQAAKASEEASRLKQVEESDRAKLETSLQQERERSARLEKDLAAARRDVGAQTALAAMAAEEALQRKQAAEAGAGELRQSMQKERERVDTTAQDPSLMRTAIYAYEVQARKAGDQPAEFRQAVANAARPPFKSGQDERARSERLEQELAAARRDLEAQTALVAKAGEKASRLQQAGERSQTELQKPLQQERERSARLEQDLAAARREVETQTALAAKANEQVSQLKEASERSGAEHQALQQERERSTRLEQDLAAARREVEAQTALTAKANEQVSQLKEASERGGVEQQTSFQQQRERSARLEQDLAAARREVETQAALAAKANEQASQLKEASERSGAELQTSFQQQRERSARLEQDLAAARREVETQTALAAKANEQASQLKEASERSGAEQQTSFQQERERSARLEQDLAAARREVVIQTTLAAKVSDEASRLKQVGASSEAELQKSLQEERERSAGLERSLATARRDIETQPAQATKAIKEALRSKQAVEADVAELRQSIQKERKKVEALGQELAIARSAIYAYEAQAAELRQAAADDGPLLRKSVQDERARAARLEQELASARRDLDMQVTLTAKASDEAVRMMQAAERDAASLRSSLDQERVRAEQLERALALAKQHAPSATSVGLAARNRPDNGKAVADRSPAAGVLSDAQPQSNKAVAALLVRASALLAQGDIGAARIVLERAIEMGSVQASFSLAETYDPLVLAKWGTLGTRGDAVRAQDLYAKADAAGIKEAKARIEALRR
ncbi:hypothetical protein [Bradyrhizobium sp. BWA-3-5]|uniref:hypothetical protein n=1 Tax=Bradyrhizobium sp. BWA-3-5 TaxID=3080013 RepID=UPI00293ECBC9|nr:hypothetical protein [Bradyrhizobium sp. BWA-3-5]WOH67888.1 hypothetical protein RX331_09255 [Bradyrhizobium sp. BWA-3-5]